MTRLGGGEAGGGVGRERGSVKWLLRKDKVLSSSVPEILVWISKNNSKSNFPEFLVQWLVFENGTSFRFSGNFRRKYLYHLPQFPKLWNFWLNRWIRPRANEVIIVSWNASKFAGVQLIVHVCRHLRCFFCCLFVVRGFVQHFTQHRLEIELDNRRRHPKKEFHADNWSTPLSLFISCQSLTAKLYLYFVESQPRG